MSIQQSLEQYGFVHTKQVFDQAAEKIRQRKDGEVTPYYTQWERLNNMLGGGIQPATIYTIGGRPGVGKSAFVNQLLFGLCKLNDMTNTAICYWTWEMPAYQQLIRGFSGEFGKTVQELMSAQAPLHEDVYAKILSSKEQWAGYPIYFMSYSQNATYIYNLMKAVHKDNPDITIINVFDHTRLVQKGKNVFNEEEKITKLYHAAQQLSVNHDMINIFLSQLNREIEKHSRREKIPMLSDFFGADSVAQFSNVAMILNQPEQFNKDRYLKEDTEDLLALHVLKNRDGDKAWIPFDHDLAHNRIKQRYPIMNTVTYQM